MPDNAYPPEFCRAALDSLGACIAVLDDSGTTIAVNAALERISELTCAAELRLGSDYFAACETAAAAGDEQRGAIARALRELLAGKRDGFTAQYVLDRASDPPRWFGVRASRFHGGGRVVMEHFDKTDFVQTHEAAQLRAQLIDRIDAAVIAGSLDGVAEVCRARAVGRGAAPRPRPPARRDPQHGRGALHARRRRPRELHERRRRAAARLGPGGPAGVHAARLDPLPQTRRQPLSDRRLPARGGPPPPRARPHGRRHVRAPRRLGPVGRLHAGAV
jgi:PAS domain-containing protein